MANSIGIPEVGLGSAVNATQVQYGLYVVAAADGTLIPMWPSALQWEEQSGELAVRLTATIPNIQLPSGWVHQLLALAGNVHLRADWGAGPTEVFRGTIWDWKFEDNGKEMCSIIAYDRLMYLQRSKDSKGYNLNADEMGVTLPGSPMLSISAGAIMDDIARRWGFSISGTGLLQTIMPKLVWQQTPISQMFKDLIDRTFWLGGGAWLLRSRSDQVEVLPPATNNPIYILTRDQIEQYSDEQDMQDLVTRVVVIGMMAASSSSPPVGDVNNFLVPVEGILDGATQYGIMQDIIQDPGIISPSNLSQLAKQTIQSRGQPRRIQRFDAPDLPFLRRGDAIAIQAGTLNGVYIVTGVQHDAAERRMQLTIDTSGNLTDSSVNFTLLPSTSPDETAAGAVYPFRPTAPKPTTAVGGIDPDRPQHRG